MDKVVDMDMKVARCRGEIVPRDFATAVKDMRQFYLAFPICDALRHELGWTGIVGPGPDGVSCFLR